MILCINGIRCNRTSHSWRRMILIRMGCCCRREYPTHRPRPRRHDDDDDDDDDDASISN